MVVPDQGDACLRLGDDDRDHVFFDDDLFDLQEGDIGIGRGASRCTEKGKKCNNESENWFHDRISLNSEVEEEIIRT